MHSVGFGAELQFMPFLRVTELIFSPSDLGGASSERHGMKGLGDRQSPRLHDADMPFPSPQGKWFYDCFAGMISDISMSSLEDLILPVFPHKRKKLEENRCVCTGKGGYINPSSWI